VYHHGLPWLVPHNRVGASWFVDLLEKYRKPVAVEYPEELPGLFKMTEEQFAAEVRFLAAAKLFELGKLSSGNGDKPCQPKGQGRKAGSKNRLAPVVASPVCATLAIR
jgi:hypothetical protein